MVDVSPSGNLFIQSDPSSDSLLYSLSLRKGNTFQALRAINSFNASNSPPQFITDSILIITRFPLTVPGDTFQTVFLDTSGNKIVDFEDYLASCSFIPASNSIVCLINNDLTLVNLTAKSKSRLKSIPDIQYLEVAPKGDVAYFTTSASSQTPAVLSMIDMASLTVTKISSDVESCIALSPDATKIAYFKYDHNELKIRIISVQ